MSVHFPCVSAHLHDCSIVLRRIEGPYGRELFISCQPPTGIADAGAQSEAIYRALLETLQAEGGDAGSVITETIHLHDPGADIIAVREARERVFSLGSAVGCLAVTTEIGQPPLNSGACLEVSVHAFLPRSAARRFRIESVEIEQARGVQVNIDGEIRFHAAGLCGAGNSAYEQTHSMFCLAEELLHCAGMAFGDVVRTWIYLREMERDYGEFNRARREFFEARRIAPVPASTAIGGGPVSSSHDLCLGIYAVKADPAPTRTVMTSPTLNEAMQYGADFVRGMRVRECNREVLFISGTASVDETGSTAHVGDFDGQARRMLRNLAALLERQGATFRDIVSAVTYVKHPSDATGLREHFKNAGFDGFPNVMVQAEVCRPDLLCETEVLAVLDRAPGCNSN